MIDCFLIGHNEVDFDGYVNMTRSMGVNSGAYKDLNLAFITHQQKHYHCMSLLNFFGVDSHELSNADFLWPVTTYLYTFLHKRGFSADFISVFQRDKEKLIKALQNGEVRSVVITTTLYVWGGPILEIIDLVRAHSSDTKIIVGGPYIDNQSKVLEERDFLMLLKSMGADVYVVSAEGEMSLVKVLRAMKQQLPLDDVANLVFRRDGNMVQTARQIEKNKLDEEMVDYSLFQTESFNNSVSIRTAKSCPFSCAFCAFPQRAGKYTYLPVDVVEQELDAIHEIGNIKFISFIDDTFNVPKKRFKEMLRMIANKPYEFAWNSYIRVDHLDDEAIELMKASRCEGVFLGAESGSNKMLKAMNKASRREDYIWAIKRFREVGIITHANLIIGFPGEDLHSVNESVSLIEVAQPDFFRAQQWYCDQSTPVWQKRAELGLQGQGFNWSHDSMDSVTAAQLVDDMFLNTQGSVWLPQYGFDTWSIYYLINRQITLSELKRYICAFNAGIRAKLLHPECGEVPDSLFRQMHSLANFSKHQKEEVV